jgi:endonuclease YncB( thermonuclease family)
MRLTKAFFVLPLMLLIVLAAGAPDEAMGRVSKVVDGDTFDVTLESCGRRHLRRDAREP